MKTCRLYATLAVPLLLLGCSRHDDATVGQQVDRAVASAKKSAADAKQSAATELEHAAAVSQEKAGVVAQKVEDAALTAAINAGIAKDPELSALRINVDTHDGHVSLYGSAPNEAAKRRAQTIAMSEKGVTGVDNKLVVESR
jgi:hyperosmotically inducible periplasmic protein